MLKYLSPTLLSLIIGAAGIAPLWSATADERNQHALAITKLMNGKIRLSADRQLKEFRDAGYPSSDPHLDKVLRAVYLDQFLNDGPEADKAKNEAELKALRAELDPLLKANKLSTVAKLIFSGGGGSAMRMVNEISRMMHPEGPGSLVAMAAEKSQLLARLMDTLGKQAEEDFNAGIEKVKANLANEVKGLELPETDPLYLKTINQGVELRLEALRPLSLALYVLRDGANRGKEFGFDPAPIQAQLTKMFTTVRPELDKKTWVEVLGIWSFEWGEFNPYVNLYCGTLLGDAINAGSKVAKDDEVESVLLTVASLSTKDFKDAGVKTAAYGLKLMAWTNLLRYRLMQNNAVSFNRGTALWQDFQKLAKTDEIFRLSTVPKSIADDLGKLYLVAGRLLQAKGDSSAASGLMAELSSVKPANPYAHTAKSWITYWNRTKSSGNDWSQRPLAMDPEKAIILARAFMTEANSTADSTMARTIYAGAAIALRNGLLGLNSGLVDDKGYVEFAPQMYQLYAYALNKMELRQHAVIASQEGARALGLKIKWYADQKKPNPWKKTNAEGKSVWNESPVSPYRVANDGLIFAGALKTRDPSTQSLYAQSIKLLELIDPDAVGENLRYQQLYALFSEGDYDAVLRESEVFLRDYPAAYLRIFVLKSAAVTQLMDRYGNPKTGDKAKLAQVSEVMVKDNQTIGKRVSDELKANPPEARRRELESAQTTIKISEVDGLLASGKFEAVITRLDAEAFKNLPTEETLAARMVRQLAKATLDWHESRKDVLAKDPVALLAAMKTYETAYANVSRGLTKLRNKSVDGSLDNSSKMLARVFTGALKMIQGLQQSGNASAELLAMVSVANRAFADLFEPTIDEKTISANVLFVAHTLWEVDEKARAAKQYRNFIALNERDKEIVAFLADPKSMAEKSSAVVNLRTEFRKPWEEIADLVWDSPEDKQAYETLPKANWPTRQRKDYFKALTQLNEFRKLMASNKAIIEPAQFKQIEATVDGLQRIILAVANQTKAKARLATYYRESGKNAESLVLLNEAYTDDPLNPDNQMALVLVTYDAALKGNPMPPKEELIKARRVVAGVRDGKKGTTDKVGYWEAYTLVMEFSIMLGEPKGVNDGLSFLRRDRSDITRDLVGPPVWGDDKRLRRPLNSLSIQLAKRFLGLYEKQGVTEKPGFKLTDIEVVAGETKSFFTDHDAPAFVAKPMTTPDDDDVIALVAADGSTPAPVKPPPPKPAEAREDPKAPTAPAPVAPAAPVTPTATAP